MAILDIKKYPDPVLREVAKPRTDFSSELAVLLDNMLETMYKAEGIGLAAPQVGLSEQIVVIDLRDAHSNFGEHEDGTPLADSPLELVNPIILSQDGSQIGEEGCLSIPGYGEKVKRAERVTVRAQDRKGEEFSLHAHGLLSVCLQHEIDHLNGILFVDHLSQLKRQLFKRWAKKHEL